MVRPDSEQNIVYKVVRRGNMLYSALIEDISWRVNYCKGGEAKSIHPHSPLFAFNSLMAAQNWCNGMWNIAIWQAKAEGIRNPLQYIPETTDTEAFAGYWRNRWLHLPQLISHSSTTPMGTVFCRTITLLEQVA